MYRYRYDRTGIDIGFAHQVSMAPAVAPSPLATLVAQDQAAASDLASDRLLALRSELDALSAERRNLEQQDEERRALRRQLSEVESEAEQARREEAALVKRIEIEGQRNAEHATTEQKRARWVDPAKTEPMDAEALTRAAATLKRRRQALTRLLASLNDPEAAVREEDALRQLEAERRELERSQQGNVRLLSQCGKQVDSSRVQVASRRGGGAIEGGPADVEDPAKREEKEEEYMRRMLQMERSMAESRRRAEAANNVVKGAWEGWFQLLSNCARRLQARTDAGEKEVPRLPEGADTTPAFKVLELVRTLSARHTELKQRVAKTLAAEQMLERRISECRSKIAHQGVALRSDSKMLEIRKARASRGSVGAPVASSAPASSTEAFSLPPLH